MTLAERHPGQKKLSLYVAEDVKLGARVLALKDKKTFALWLEDLMQREVERRKQDVAMG